MSNAPIIGATYDDRANNCAKYLHTQLTLLGKPEDYLTEEAWEHELKTIASAYRHHQAKIDYPNSDEHYQVAKQEFTKRDLLTRLKEHIEQQKYNPNSIETYTIHVAYPIITAIDKVDTNLYNNTHTPSTRHHANKGFFARIFGI